MFTRLYLIRHGETENSEPKRYKGHLDVPLSEKGIKQMERLSKYIVQDCSNSSNRLNGLNGLTGLNTVYTSDLIRAVKSAEIIADPYGIEPIVVPDFKERNFGIWEDMSFDEIREKYPKEFEAWANNPLKFSPIRGESTIEVKDRVLRVFNEILEKHKGENIVIVSHGGINRIMLCHILGIPLENLFGIEQDYAALNIIEFYDKCAVVKLINGVVN